MDSVATLEDVIKENSNLVNSICLKYGNYQDKEDLYQVGMLGIVNAYNNFDKSHNVKFSTYAFPYIVGEVSKYVRENKNIKVSKDIIRLGRKINEYIDKYYEVKGYKPSIHDISLMLNIKEEKVIRVLETYKMETKSLNESINDDGKELTLLDVTSEKKIITSEDMLDLKEAFKYLSYDEKAILINRYFKDLTQSEVAKMMNVNQVMVSRLEKKALTKLKKKLI